MSVRRFRSATTVILLGLLGVGCGSQDVVTAPPQVVAPRSLDLASAPGQVTKLACPRDVDLWGTAVVGPEGGTVNAGAVRVDFPAGAVTAQQTFTAHVVGGTYVDVELTAGDSAHYTFAIPVTVTLDLSRCGSLPLGLRAFYMDSQTKTLLEDMGGTLDLTGKTLRFTTPHFSGYTVGW
jgi:hypothetical protein